MLAKQAGHGWLRNQGNKDGMTDDDLFFLQADVEFGQKQEADFHGNWLHIFICNCFLDNSRKVVLDNEN